MTVEPKRPTKAEAIANLIEIYAAALADPVTGQQIRRARERSKTEAEKKPA